MGICLIFVNIEVQSKLFNHTCLETAVYCVPYRLGSYLQWYKLDPVIWIVLEIFSRNHFGKWGSAHCGWCTNENHEVIVPSDTRLWPCNKHPIMHGIWWIFSFQQSLLKSLLRTSCLQNIKQIPIALYIKTSLPIGIGDWVSHRLLEKKSNNKYCVIRTVCPKLWDTIWMALLVTENQHKRNPADIIYI